MTCQPARRSLRKFRASRTRSSPILARQNGDIFARQTVKRYPCQKSPSMNTATFGWNKTMSGEPGSPRGFCENGCLDVEGPLRDWSQDPFLWSGPGTSVATLSAVRLSATTSPADPTGHFPKNQGH